MTDTSSSIMAAIVHRPGGATARCLYQLGSMYADQGRMGQAANVLGRALNLSIRASMSRWHKARSFALTLSWKNRKSAGRC